MDVFINHAFLAINTCMHHFKIKYMQFQNHIESLFTYLPLPKITENRGNASTSFKTLTLELWKVFTLFHSPQNRTEPMRFTLNPKPLTDKRNEPSPMLRWQRQRTSHLCTFLHYLYNIKSRANSHHNMLKTAATFNPHKTIENVAEKTEN